MFRTLKHPLMFLLVFLCASTGCKENQSDKTDKSQANSSNSKTKSSMKLMAETPTYISTEDSKVPLNYYFDFEAEEILEDIGELQVNTISRREIRLSADENNVDYDTFRDSVAGWFPLDGTYKIVFEDGEVGYFRYSRRFDKKDPISFRYNLKWIKNEPKKAINGFNANFYRVDIPFVQNGAYSLTTVGDSRLMYANAQGFRDIIADRIPGMFAFIGESQDTNGYGFSGRDVNKVSELIDHLDLMPSSDFYLISAGFNDWKNDPDKIFEQIKTLLSKILDKNPDAHLMVTTLPEVADKMKKSDKRNEFISGLNSRLREEYHNSGVGNISLIDLSAEIEKQDLSNFLRNDGQHLNDKAFSLYFDLFLEELMKLEITRKEVMNYYLGFLEGFDHWPFSDQVFVQGSGNTTTAAYYKIDEMNDRRYHVSGLIPTIGLSTPHRAELSMELEPYFQNDSIWIGVDFLIPETFDIDDANHGKEMIIFQIHSKPEADQDWKYYQQYLPFNSPSVALSLRKDGEKFNVVLRYGLTGKDEFEYKGYKWWIAGLKEVERGNWNRFVVNLKNGFNNQGYIRSWLNDDFLTPFNGSHNRVHGANMHNAALPYLKMGQYRYWGDSHYQEIFYDNLSVEPSMEKFFFLQEIPDVYRNDREATQDP